HAIVCLVGAGMWRAVPELLGERGWQGRWKRKQQMMLPSRVFDSEVGRGDDPTNAAGRLRSCRLEEVGRVLGAVKQASPGAGPRKPADIFAYVLDAIRAHKVAPTTMPSPDA